MVIPATEMLIRLSAGAMLGAAIGYERESTGRPAGLRTPLLVALASTTFMLVSTQFVYFQQYEKDDFVMVDTSRIAASVVAGVGFLGAGAILRTGLSVQGLTTAASLWLVAALGLAAGGGMYLVAFISTAVSLLVLTVVRRVENKNWRLLKRQLVFVLDDVPFDRETSLSRLREFGARDVVILKYDRDVQAKQTTIEVDVSLSDEKSLDAFLDKLESLPHLRRITVERPLL